MKPDAMMQQTAPPPGSLWSSAPSKPAPKLPPHNRTEASREGAKAARERFAEKQRRILGAIIQRGPLTDAEIVDWTGIMRSSVCSSRGALADAKLIELMRDEDGRDYLRPSRMRDGTVSERRHQVWRATDAGIEQHRKATA